MNIIKYPDNTSYVNNTELKDIVFKINTYEDLWHLNQYVDAYNDQWNEKPTITIPCLLDAQADKRFNKGESSGLKLVCQFLNNLKVKNYKIFHPHNQEVVEALIDNVIILNNKQFIKEVLIRINSENLVLLSPDAGAYKWITKLADNLEFTKEVISASKSRKWKDGHSVLTQVLDKQDFEGKDVLVIDDLLIGGGSMKGLSTLLKTKNVGKLYCAVSHITVQNLGEDPVTNYFDTVFTTNSKFDKYWFTNTGGHEESIDNLKIIKLF